MKRLFRFVGAVVNMAIVSPTDTARDIKDTLKDALSGDAGAADATFAVIGVVVGLVVIGGVVVLVLHYFASAKTASTNVDNGLNSVP